MWPENVKGRTTVLLMALHRLVDVVEKKRWPEKTRCAAVGGKLYHGSEGRRKYAIAAVERLKRPPGGRYVRPVGTNGAERGGRLRVNSFLSCFERLA